MATYLNDRLMRGVRAVYTNHVEDAELVNQVILQVDVEYADAG
jgi:hypothetical protein